MPSWLKGLIFAVIVVAGVGYAYTRLTPHKGPGGPPDMAAMGGMPGGGPPVSVAEVMEREVQIWDEFSGRLVAVDQAEIRPRVSGTIESTHFQDGTVVNKGNLLFTIDQRPFQAELDRAQAALASAQAQAALARSDFDRAERLFKEKAIAQRDYDQRRNDRNVAEANLKSAQAAVVTAQLNLDYTLIRAPIAGRVSRPEITVGNLVEAGPNAPVLTRVISSAPIYADFEIAEDKYIRYAQAGVGNSTKAEIPVTLGLATETNTPHTGRIQSFDNQLNIASGTIRARAIFDNADGVLVPGLFARIRLGGTAAQKAVLITDRAVGTDQDKRFVYVIDEKGAAQYREVSLGVLADGLRIVTSGLKPGEKIIVNGLQRVQPGAPVTPEMVPMDPSAAFAGGGSPRPGQAAEPVPEMPGRQ